jgi:uncharacterized membrane protein YphA (DoxX/SURF4 family)
LPRTTDGGAIVLIRLLVGGVFLVEGILKYLQPQELAAGRFAAIGIPWPQVMGPLVCAVEIIAGAMVIVGVFTRLACVPLLIDISVAIASTKIPIWLGRGYWHFMLPPMKHYGMLAMLHEARTDLSMLLGLIFLLIVGPGSWSADALFASPLSDAGR